MLRRWCLPPYRLGARAEPAGETIDQALCRMIEGAAATHRMPVDFFTRLIWQESSFRPGAQSGKGAQGVAQFMPGTAAERGLADPFDPEQAIPKSAELLDELRGRFGNLGLAAAAYNGGPARVEAWLAGRGGLPAETRDYVSGITGRTADDWASARGAAVHAAGRAADEVPRAGCGVPARQRPAHDRSLWRSDRGIAARALGCPARG